MGRRIYFKTFGCRTNQYDTEFLKSQLRRVGYEIAENPEDADVVVVNSCAVTHKAERESKREVRRHLKTGKEVVYTGCAAKVNPYDLAHFTGAVEDVLRYFGVKDVSPIDGFTRARGILKVQEGCDFACSYCIIKFARGKSRSLPLERVLEDADNLTKVTREITLTGIQIGDWGKEWGLDLAYLLTVLTDRYPNVRFRISSISPVHITERLLGVMVERDNVCPHLHVSVQSGSNRILKAMARPYTREFYERKLNLIYSFNPSMAVGTDVIVGFPGETEEDFEDTLSLIRGYPFAYVHAFEYSPRPGTPAYGLEEVPAPVRKERMRKIQALIAEKRRAYRRLFVGKVLNVYVEKEEGGLLYGTSENYLKVALPGSGEMVGNIVPVRILKDRGTGFLLGEAVEVTV